MIGFRNASIKDIDKIMAIEKDCFKIGVREKKNIFKKRLDVFADGFIVITDNDEVIGYACGEIWKKDTPLSEKAFALGHNPFDAHDVNGNRFYISSMGIFKTKRGGGIGKLLFSTLIERIMAKYPNIDELILVVAEDWDIAKSIYEKQGFNKTFVLQNFFKPRGEKEVGGIVMNKKL